MSSKREEHWAESALCSQTDPEIFFPPSRNTGYTARKICVMCDVRAECLREALVSRRDTPDGTLYGIWGGYGSHNRHKIWQELTEKGSKPVPPVEDIRDWLTENGELAKHAANRWG